MHWMLTFILKLMCLMSVTEMFDILFSLYLENVIMQWFKVLFLFYHIPPPPPKKYQQKHRISIHVNKYLLYVILSYYMYTCIFQIPILNQLFHHEISYTVVKSKFVTWYPGDEHLSNRKCLQNIPLTHFN